MIELYRARFRSPRSPARPPNILRRGAAAVLGLAALAMLPAHAEVPGSADLDILPRPARAEIVDYRVQDSVERLYPQSALRRISGRLRVDAEIDAVGRLTALTYELSPGHGSGEAFAQVRATLLEQGARALHWCEGRECGASSLWANNVFGNARLYGPDEQQAYLLLQLAAPRQDSLVALYAVTRGTRRAYLHVELLESAAPLGEHLPNAETLLRQLKDVGELTLSGLPSEPDDPWLALLAKVLRLDTGLRVQLSGQDAPAWREALIERGTRAARLESAAAEAPALRLERLR
ncbi:protein of unknown function [Pseudomonas oryzae]|uniref:DUF4892 domain-containing protein n=2 Tax=Pseudomonas oryzae TaxID=1392877 RepID=A0A1H1S377_9PSED|nr:protein of unknown function [Pseudomonas oryzae]